MQGQTMRDKFHAILVVGPHELFPKVFDRLESNESYDLRYAFDLEFARGLLKEYTPAAIVLALPDDQQSIRRALIWIDAVKTVAPVLVLASVEDRELYAAAMESGAFDFLMPGTPAEGVEWILSNTLHRGVGAAA